MSTLPPDWTLMRLDEVASVQGGIQKQAKRRPVNNRYPFLRVANVLRGKLVLDDVHEVELFNGELDRHRLQAGDLLVVEGNGSPDHIGRAAIWDGSIANCVHQNHLIRVRPSSKILPKYLELAWNAPQTADYLRAVAGSTSGLYTLSTAKLKAVNIPVCPPNEQARIVDLLEDHLSRLDAAAGALSKSMQRIEIMRQAALASAIKQADEHPSSTIVSVGSLGRVGSGATPLKSTKRYYEGGEIPWVTSGDLHAGHVTAPRHFITIDALNETAVKLYPPGTLLVAMYGEGKTRGTVAELLFEATTNQACAAIVLNPEFEAVRPWLRLVLTSNYWALRRLAAGGVQPNLSLGIVKALKLPLPNADVQKRLIKECESLMDAASRLRHEAGTAIKRITSLRRSLLSAAFSGRMTAKTIASETIEELVSV